MFTWLTVAPPFEPCDVRLPLYTLTPFATLLSAAFTILMPLAPLSVLPERLTVPVVEVVAVEPSPTIVPSVAPAVTLSITLSLIGWGLLCFGAWCLAWP